MSYFCTCARAGQRGLANTAVISSRTSSLRCPRPCLEPWPHWKCCESLEPYARLYFLWRPGWLCVLLAVRTDGKVPVPEPDHVAAKRGFPQPDCTAQTVSRCSLPSKHTHTRRKTLMDSKTKPRWKSTRNRNPDEVERKRSEKSWIEYLQGYHHHVSPDTQFEIRSGSGDDETEMNLNNRSPGETNREKNPRIKVY